MNTTRILLITSTLIFSLYLAAGITGVKDVIWPMISPLMVLVVVILYKNHSRRLLKRLLRQFEFWYLLSSAICQSVLSVIGWNHGIVWIGLGYPGMIFGTMNVMMSWTTMLCTDVYRIPIIIRKTYLVFMLIALMFDLANMLLSTNDLILMCWRSKCIQLGEVRIAIGTNMIIYIMRYIVQSYCEPKCLMLIKDLIIVIRDRSGTKIVSSSTGSVLSSPELVKDDSGFVSDD